MKASTKWGNAPNSVAARIKPAVPNRLPVGFTCMLPEDKAEVLMGVKGRSRFLSEFLLEHWELVVEKMEKTA
jgi:hypothetical protein